MAFTENQIYANPWGTPDLGEGTSLSDPSFSSFARAIGLSIAHSNNGEVVTGIHPSQHNASRSDPNSIDFLAIPGLIDHSAGAAIYSLIKQHIGISTFDLRTDFFTDRIAGKVTAKTRVISTDSTSATVLSQVYDTTKLVAHGTGLLRIGSFPAGRGQREQVDFEVNQQGDSLRKTLGINSSGASPSYDSQNLAIIGWKDAHAIHGGATAALLMEACQQCATRIAAEDEPQRLASLNVNFVRPGLGGVALLSKTDVIRQGKAGSMVYAECFHQPHKLVALAQATLVSGS